MSAARESVALDLVRMGCILDAHGIRGSVKIRSFTQCPEDISRYGSLCNALGEEKYLILSLEATAKKDLFVARLEGVETRTLASSLRGTNLYLPRSRLPETSGEEWYYVDLVGLQAVLPCGRRLGSVVDVDDHGAGTFLKIRGNCGRTDFLPFTRAFVPDVDIVSGHIVVSLPEDCFSVADLYRTSRE